MAETRAQRTLVKSPPELWAEISDVGALARHLGEFGEIRITRLEPETAVVWEGDRARGTVQLEPSGWGTKVTLTAEMPHGGEAADRGDAQSSPAAEASPPAGGGEAEAEAVVVSEPEPEPEPEPVAAAEPVAAPEPAEEPRLGFFARLFGGRKRRRLAEAAAAEQPAATDEGAKEEQPAVVEEPAVPEPATVASEPVASEPVASEPVASEPVASEPVASEPVASEPPVVEEPVASEPDGPSPALDLGRAEAILTEVLDDLGAAHHRPFSRLS